ncbi:hypothetical protein SNOG_14329 [Parastagonospora nodorum SN15]|uniref:Uncharacterized protein n=2 Tax=Phaeosphaeria nodorum (strain SN15 / ATCC MYA-4574 / FGSC 10173) TaxID=321614 RepID=A0A7U2F6S2_PHANO|nr:hypothetical protein SNOG_14329 [Parastagonospora nodorum SN15]EAT78200.1 hypothetical protein SNOG_14329 [Parastagonospora nodorum SN15]QRC99412.1 hypothetical protein JI435_143290 [Parastagonospora nodorum SN15]
MAPGAVLVKSFVRKRKVARLQSHMSLAIMTILVEDILR